jgi:hypothetical protein
MLSHLEHVLPMGNNYADLSSVRNSSSTEGEQSKCFILCDKLLIGCSPVRKYKTVLNIL